MLESLRATQDTNESNVFDDELAFTVGEHRRHRIGGNSSFESRLGSMEDLQKRKIKANPRLRIKAAR